MVGRTPSTLPPVPLLSTLVVGLAPRFLHLKTGNYSDAGVLWHLPSASVLLCFLLNSDTRPETRFSQHAIYHCIIPRISPRDVNNAVN